MVHQFPFINQIFSKLVINNEIYQRWLWPSILHGMLHQPREGRELRKLPLPTVAADGVPGATEAVGLRMSGPGWPRKLKRHWSHELGDV
jgi:hypothetical protein